MKEMKSRTVDIAQLAGLRGLSTSFSHLGDDYVMARVTDGESFRLLEQGPFKVNGLLWILCRRGGFDVEVNFTKYHQGENTLIITGADSLLMISGVDEGETDCYILGMSGSFLRDTNIDINVLSTVPMLNVAACPVMDLGEEVGDVMARYMELLHINTAGDGVEPYRRSISRTLIASMCYSVMQAQALKHSGTDVPRQRSRRATYVYEFKGLVNKYHKLERSVGFYADKMFISPKYLSLIIKEATGRSAAEWIDEMVILEAKNLLRFSGKNIQQVAYELNFSNQSSFGKYFKHLTGMSPSEYQRS